MLSFSEGLGLFFRLRCNTGGPTIGRLPIRWSRFFRNARCCGLASIAWLSAERSDTALICCSPWGGYAGTRSSTLCVATFANDLNTAWGRISALGANSTRASNTALNRVSPYLWVSAIGSFDAPGLTPFIIQLDTTHEVQFEIQTHGRNSDR
jgi:hypothetical protein